MNRARAFAGLAGLLGLGAVVAGLADPWPESVRAVATLALVLALPAYLVHGAVSTRAGAFARNPALSILVAFLAWLCVLALWTTVFSAAHAPFRVYAIATIWTLLAWFAADAVMALRRRPPGPPPSPGRAVWWLLLACAVFAAAYPPLMSIAEDGLDHAGYVRRILTDNSLRPAGVLALPAGDTYDWPDPRKGALHAVFALCSWISSADPLVTWRWLSAVMFPASVMAVLAFNFVFVASRLARLACALLVVLTFDGNPFRFAGASAHGESVAGLWCWVLTAMAIASAPHGPRWYVWMLLSAGGVLVHLGVAWHVLVLGSTMALFGGAWGIPRRQRFASCGALAGGLVLALVLRREDLAGGTNIIHAHTQGVLFLWNEWFVASPLEILRQHGLIFLGGLACVPVLVCVARARADARAILAASAIPFVVSFVPWAATWMYEHGSYMVFRSLLHVPAFAAIVVCAAALAAGVRRRDRRALLIGLPAAALWLIVFMRPVPAALVRGARAASIADRGTAAAGVERELIRTVGGFASGSVVLSDPATSYVLSAHTSSRFVALYQQHGNPRDPYAMERIQAARDVLSPFVAAETALSACRRFGVDYVVVNGDPPGDETPFLRVWQGQAYAAAVRRMESFGAAFTRIADTGDARVYRFEPSAVANLHWTTHDQPVITATPALEQCIVEAPGYRFRITGVSVEPPRVLPGDTLHVTLGYYRDSMSRLSFPMVVHLRFDHDTLDSEREFPGEKQWRRLADGRAGVRSRFRADLRPGHGVYEPDLWPVGFDLCETFDVVVPSSARTGNYDVQVSIDQETQVPNFHVRDLLFNRDHYSGTACASLAVVDRLTVPEAHP